MKKNSVTKKADPNTSIKRLQVDMTEERLEAFDALIHECGLKTRKDVFDYAMTILYWAVRESRFGNEIASVSQKDKRLEILRTPIFDHVRLIAERKVMEGKSPAEWSTLPADRVKEIHA